MTSVTVGGHSKVIYKQITMIRGQREIIILLNLVSQESGNTVSYFARNSLIGFQLHHVKKYINPHSPFPLVPMVILRSKSHHKKDQLLHSGYGHNQM